MQWNEETFWRVLPSLLPVLAYLLGWFKDRWNLPRPITRLLANKEGMGLVLEGVESAARLSGKSDAERQEIVRTWLKTEVYKLFGECISDSALNFLIEKVIADRKAAE